MIVKSLIPTIFLYLCNTGLLGTVHSLKLLSVHLRISTLTWDPPFSLDLTNVHPDVIYCVDIYNITCGVAQHLVSDCNVSEPYYTFYSEDEIHKFIVTPKNNVANSRNGTTSFQSGTHILMLLEEHIA